MRHALRQFETRRSRRGPALSVRRGFTLVEMLVAVSIIVVLTALSIGAFQFNASERTISSANIFKNALEGARSRAIRSGQVRGLRLIPDPNDPRIITSLQYIGAQGYDEGECQVDFIAGEWVVTNWDDPTFPANPRGHATNVVDLHWNNLAGRGLITSGSRIEIPASSGNWMTVTAILFDQFVDPYAPPPPPVTPPTRDVVKVAGHFANSTFNTAANTWESNLSLPIRYRWEFQPTPLPEDPVLLAQGTCIDLDGSTVDPWRSSEDVNKDGILMINPPAPPPTIPAETDANGSGTFEFSTGYGTIDILFGPNGQMIGRAKAEGILHFRIAFISDVLLARTNDLRNLPIPASPANAQYPNTRYVVPADPERDHRAVSIFTNTGAFLISEIDRADDDGVAPFNSIPATNPFRFAVQGRDTN